MSEFTKNVTGMLDSVSWHQTMSRINSRPNIYKVFGILSSAYITGKKDFTLKIDNCTGVRMGYFELRAVAEFFGTDKIDTDEYRKAGCDTCGYGSEDYVSVIVYDATKNFPKCLFEGIQENLSEEGPGYPDEKTKADIARPFTQA